MTQNYVLTLNTKPNQQELSQLISPALAQKLPVILTPLWNDKNLARQLTNPDAARFIAASAIEAMGGGQSLLDLVFVFGLFGSVAGYRDMHGGIEQEGVRNAMVMLQPTMPNINDVFANPDSISALGLCERSKLALQVVTLMIEKTVQI